ncbi:unnamed protein product [Brachionus calyciflorus]|uniref:Uncharacterized protein n=1 Tax=Brachionus calyciflorus TaxID=104777 RepID=A0A814QER0_9BILA|nr:unnamed protein product [Brachionus calyciflorus]
MEIDYSQTNDAQLMETNEFSEINMIQTSPRDCLIFETINDEMRNLSDSLVENPISEQPSIAGLSKGIRYTFSNFNSSKKRGIGGDLSSK